MDYNNLRLRTREEICGIFGTPPPVVGIYDNATFNNVNTARMIFWVDTIIPLMEDLTDVWNLALAPEFGPEWRVEYDFSKVQALQQLFSDKVKSAVELFKMGVPFNEINSRLDLGFSPIAGGDVGYIAATNQPVTESVAGSLSGSDDPNAV